MDKKNKKGILYGIGVGCGNSSDMSLKATYIIAACDIIVFPAGTKDKCRAYDITRKLISNDQKTVFFDFPMTRDKEALADRHRKIYEEIKGYLDDGKTVAFITIGDPLIYSTFSYIAELARADRCDVRTINGIPSFLSCAAELSLFLGQNDEEIHIIPGSADIHESLELSGMKVFMKLGKHFDELKQALNESPSHVFLGAVNHCGMDDEAVYYSLSEIPEGQAYLMTAFVR